MGVSIMGLDWNDTQEIGEQLFDKYDSVNPLSVRFSDLRKWILDLEDFSGKPTGSNDKVLEAIQKAWYEEWKIEYGDD
jgi:FeS assembly protein IscX